MTPHETARRDFLKESAAATVVAGTGAAPLLAAGEKPAPKPAATKAPRAKSCILLWMGGGPSQKETFDLKPESEHPGDFKPIQTSVTGIQICELLPKMAKQMQHAAILRTMVGGGDHNRGTYFAHTGVALGSGGLVYPTLGSVVSAEVERPGLGIPKFVLLGNVRYGGSPGFLGAGHAPLVFSRLGHVQDMTSQKTEAAQLAREQKLLDELEEDFQRAHDVPLADAHRKTVRRAAQFMHAKELKALDLTQEKAATRDAYGSYPGDGAAPGFDFCQGCLTARRLVEADVPFVEVTVGGWDHHNNIARNMRSILPPLDAAVSTLVSDLKDRGLLDSTLIVMVGEMGRGPTIPPAGANYGLGRHHWGRVMSAVVMGGGIKGGQVIGRTDKQGGEPDGRSVHLLDLQATIYELLGIDHTRDHKVEPGGRPVPILKRTAKAVPELIG
jgi:hypothetical protein